MKVRAPAKVLIAMLSTAAILSTAVSSYAQQGSTLEASAPAGRGGGQGAPLAAGRGGGGQPASPSNSQRVAMLDALPAAPIVRPAKPRKVLVFSRPAAFAHGIIPLASLTVQNLGDKTGAWTTTISNDPADFNTANLAQYDAIVLNNNTGAFLDAPDDPAATAARRAALLAFVRGGKGLVGLHGASDSYHGGAAGRGATQPTPIQPAWPEFNTMIGGIFRWHWNFPTQITVKIDDPASPLTRMFPRTGFSIHDEIYVLDNASFSRANVRVLMSVDYAKMSDATKALDGTVNRRTDGDYALSWIRREGQGRVFYQALGHDEHVLAMPPILQNLLAGVQYATGDLTADDRPSLR